MISHTDKRSSTQILIYSGNLNTQVLVKLWELCDSMLMEIGCFWDIISA